MRCVRCGSEQTRRDGSTRLGGQRWRCAACRRRFTARSTSAFSRRGFPDDLSALAVRWYVRSRLSDADLAEWLAERGCMVERSTLYCWIHRFLPLFNQAARACRRSVGARWRVDETDVRLSGRWVSVSRAIDDDGQVVEASCRERRTAAAAEVFFTWAIDTTGITPTRIITDTAGGSLPARRL